MNHNVLMYWNNEKETNLVKTNKASWQWPNDQKISIQIPSELWRAEMSSHPDVRALANWQTHRVRNKSPEVNIRMLTINLYFAYITETCIAHEAQRPSLQDRFSGILDSQHGFIMSTSHNTRINTETCKLFHWNGSLDTKKKEFSWQHFQFSLLWWWRNCLFHFS